MSEGSNIMTNKKKMERLEIAKRTLLELSPGGNLHIETRSSPYWIEMQDLTINLLKREISLLKKEIKHSENTVKNK
jgi:hypothetical protein